MATLRQLHFAITDPRLHSRIDKNEGKTADEIRREIAKTTVIAPIQEDKFLCCFSHILQADILQDITPISGLRF